MGTRAYTIQDAFASIVTQINMMQQQLPVTQTPIQQITTATNLVDSGVVADTAEVFYTVGQTWAIPFLAQVVLATEISVPNVAYDSSAYTYDSTFPYDSMYPVVVVSNSHIYPSWGNMAWNERIPVIAE